MITVRLSNLETENQRLLVNFLYRDSKEGRTKREKDHLNIKNGTIFSKKTFS